LLEIARRGGSFQPIEVAIGLVKDWLKGRIDGWNTAALERKKRETPPKPSLETSSHNEVTLTETEKATADLEVSPIQVRDLVLTHLSVVQRWCSTVGFADMRGAKDTQTIYVELDTFVTPTRLHIDRAERNITIPLSAALTLRSQHCIILGQPGAGKTTAMKKLCTVALNTEDRSPEHGFPILIRFKDLSGPVKAGSYLTEALARIFGFGVRMNGPPAFRRDFTDLDREAFLLFLDELEALVIFDGFDEFYDNTLKRQLADEIRSLTLRLTRTKIVVTCRTGEFNYSIDNCEILEIAPLSGEQIKEFSLKWLGDPDKAQKFTDEVYKSPLY
jgi:hypothetical protein